MAAHSIAEAKSFLDSVELDPADDLGLESDEGPLVLGQPNFITPEDQSLLVGSQIAGFSADVPVKLRPMLTNVFLLAQLVADKKSQGLTTSEWYRNYFETLTKVGWQKIEQTNSEQVISGTSLEVHREIIPIVTAALGPSVSAASSVVTILKGLDSMDKDLPWITLFNKKSRRAKSYPFQFSQTVMQGGVPTIVLVAFELDAARSVTQVLFFKFSDDEAKLSHYSESLSAAIDMLKATEVKVKSLVFDHISSNLASMDDLGL